MKCWLISGTDDPSVSKSTVHTPSDKTGPYPVLLNKYQQAQREVAQLKEQLEIFAQQQ